MSRKSTKNPTYVVIEIIDGEKVRRISGSYALCSYVAEELRLCGFKAEVVLEDDQTRQELSQCTKT